MPTCGDPGRPPCRCRGRATRGRRSSEPDRGATNGRQRRRNACRKTRSRKQGRWREFVQPSTLILSHRPTDCRHHRDRSIDLLLGRLRRGRFGSEAWPRDPKAPARSCGGIGLVPVALRDRDSDGRAAAASLRAQQAFRNPSSRRRWGRDLQLFTGLQNSTACFALGKGLSNNSDNPRASEREHGSGTEPAVRSEREPPSPTRKTARKLALFWAGNRREKIWENTTGAAVEAGIQHSPVASESRAARPRVFGELRS